MARYPELTRLLFCLCLLAAGEALADCEISGKVTASIGPLSGAEVSMEVGGSETNQTTTLADGRYRLDYQALPIELQSAWIRIKANGYAEDSRLFFRGANDSCLEFQENDVMLLPVVGAPSDFSSLGQKIFVSPYALYGEGSESIATRFNHDLPNIVYHKIQAYKSSLGLSSVQIDISVGPLNEQISPAEGERILRLGHSLNALGVITGDGDLVASEHGAGEIQFTSVFRTIPIYRDLGTGIQPISDRIPSESVSPSRIAGRLHDLWGKQALLSIVLQRLATHEGEWATEDLDLLHDILVDIRNTMLPDDRLLELTNELLQAVDENRPS